MKTIRTATLFLAALGCAATASASISFNYQVQAGNQSYSGPLGMDFDVVAPISISSLGVFDSNADGLGRQLTAYIYDRDTQTSVASLIFAVGNTGTLVGGERFLALSTPLVLAAGFHGSVVVEGYGAGELNGNGNPPFNYATLDDGGGLINFVGTSRYGGTPGLFPTFLDVGPSNRYGAGTFVFDPADLITPEPSTVVLLAGGLALLARMKSNRKK
jgi:hypothetical protein